MTKKERELVQEYMAMTRCHIGTHDGGFNQEDTLKADAYEIELHNKLAKIAGIKPI